MLFIETSKPRETQQQDQDQQSRLSNSSLPNVKPDDQQVYEESKRVLSELKPAPRAKESVERGGARVRDSYSSLNQEARVVEEVIRQSGPANGISDQEMAYEVTLAKNYVVDAGERTEVKQQEKPQTASWEAGLDQQLKESMALARGIPLAELIPQAESIPLANKLSNASPQALSIAQTEGIPIASALEIPLIQAIAHSQERLVVGQPVSTAVGEASPTLSDTLDRIRNFARFGVTSDSLVIPGSGREQSREQLVDPMLVA